MGSGKIKSFEDLGVWQVAGICADHLPSWRKFCHLQRSSGSPIR